MSIIVKVTIAIIVVLFFVRVYLYDTLENRFNGYRMYTTLYRRIFSPEYIFPYIKATDRPRLKRYCNLLLYVFYGLIAFALIFTVASQAISK